MFLREGKRDGWGVPHSTQYFVERNWPSIVLLPVKVIGVARKMKNMSALNFFGQPLLTAAATENAIFIL